MIPGFSSKIFFRTFFAFKRSEEYPIPTLMIRRRFPVLVRFVSGALDTELFGIVMTRLSVVRSVVYTRPMDSTVPSPEPVLI